MIRNIYYISYFFSYVLCTYKSAYIYYSYFRINRQFNSRLYRSAHILSQMWQKRIVYFSEWNTNSGIANSFSTIASPTCLPIIHFIITFEKNHTLVLVAILTICSDDAILSIRSINLIVLYHRMFFQIDDDTIKHYTRVTTSFNDDIEKYINLKKYMCVCVCLVYARICV